MPSIDEHDHEKAKTLLGTDIKGLRAIRVARRSSRRSPPIPRHTRRQML
jgi:hypothetical protein